jgi:hypothetical protein
MVPDIIRQFFEAYRDAFVHFDGARVAASYHAPSILARGDSYVLWATPAEVRANCEALVDGYRNRGTERAEYEISGFQRQGSHFAIVTLDWTIYSRQAEAPLSFHATYNLFEQEGNWRILVATLFD